MAHRPASQPQGAGPLIRAADLKALIARQSGEAPAPGGCRFQFDALPPQISAALALAVEKDRLDVAFAAPPEEDRQRLSGSFDAALAALGEIWPGMAETVRRHMAAVVIHQGRTTTSHRYFAGTVVLAARELDQPALGVKDSIGETLAHEVTHQTLYCLQEQGPLILPPPNTRFISPWSGATRSLLLCAHIVPVYYAVIEYLHRLRLSGKADKAGVVRRIGTVLDGMDVFFREGIGRPFLTPVGRALHGQIEAAISARRAAYLSS